MGKLLLIPVFFAALIVWIYCEIREAPLECISCGWLIEAGKTICPKCGQKHLES